MFKLHITCCHCEPPESGPIPHMDLEQSLRHCERSAAVHAPARHCERSAAIHAVCRQTHASRAGRRRGDHRDRVQSLPQPELGGAEGGNESAGRFCWRNLYELQSLQGTGIDYVAVGRGSNATVLNEDKLSQQSVLEEVG